MLKYLIFFSSKKYYFDINTTLQSKNKPPSLRRRLYHKSHHFSREFFNKAHLSKDLQQIRVVVGPQAGIFIIIRYGFSRCLDIFLAEGFFVFCKQYSVGIENTLLLNFIGSDPNELHPEEQKHTDKHGQTIGQTGLLPVG